METVQINLDKELLLAADQAARRSRQNRSALIGTALRAYLRNLELREMDKRDREGYLRTPQNEEDSVWDAVTAWPED